MTTESMEHTLGRFIAESSWNQLSEEIILASKRCIMDYLGVGIRGAQEQTVKILDEWIESQGDVNSRGVRLLGTSRSSARQNAALHNGVASHVLDFDDTHIPTILHPSSPVCSAIWPAAERLEASGQDVLVAFYIGYEVSARIARTIFPAHYDRGWHMTGTAGSFGAAAATASLLNLNASQCVHALGLAATSASGLRENFGSMAKSFHSGIAARNGLLAAELAALGYTASESALSGKRGFLSVMSDESHPEILTQALGQTHELLVRHSVKPYPCGVVLHPVLDAACRLKQRLGDVDPNQIEDIVATVNPYVLELTAKENPKVGLEGKFSIYYTVAVAMLRGQVDVDDFTDERVHDDNVRALMKTVRADVEQDKPVSHAKIAVFFKDGSREEQIIEGSRGMPETPMTDTELEAKFDGLLGSVLGAAATERLRQSVMNLDTVPQFNEVLEFCTPQ